MKKIFKNYIVRKTTIETKKYLTSSEILTEKSTTDDILEEFLTGKYRKPSDSGENFTMSGSGCLTAGYCGSGSSVKSGELLGLEEDYEVIEVK